MKRYDSYKESSFQHLDELPSNWMEGKIRYYFSIGRGRVISRQELKEEGIYPVYSSQTKNSGCLGFIDTYDYEGEKLTWTTDGANAGEVFYRKGKYNCTNVCGILEPKSNELYLRFYLYYLRFITQFFKRPDTNGAKIMSNEMADIHALIPSLQEQAKIAQFLDHKTGIIDALIEKKEQLIAKLEEERQAIINEAVTKGLDPKAKMKDSGVEWLGEIPEGWGVCKIKHLVEMKSGDFISAGEIESKGPFPVYGGNGLRGYTSKFNKQGSYILIGRQGAHCGNVKYAHNNFWATEHAVVCKFKRECDLYFMGELFRTMNLNQYNESAAQPGLSVLKIQNLNIPKVPYDVQIKISDFIRSKIKLSKESESILKDQILKLKEYRQSLISEAVTGKVDVRDWEAKIDLRHE